MRILITGIGGNVAQGILRNLKRIQADAYLVGTNTVAFSAGNHLCNTVYSVPYAFDEQYIPTLLHIVSTEQIQLIIPSTDYEVEYLSKNAHLFSVPIVCSGAYTSAMCNDKYLNFKEFNSFQIPFADSCLPSEGSKHHWQQFLAKPRKGRGSRGILINPTHIEHLSDDEYMLQELHSGLEITTAVYVDAKSTIHAILSMSRSLSAGTTIECEVIDTFDDQCYAIARQMVQHFDFKASFNIQSIVSQGKVVPFEINCRISGTNSIRSHFGFDELQWILNEYYYKTDLPQFQKTYGKATRILMDVIYTPNQSEFNSNSDFIVF